MIEFLAAFVGALLGQLLIWLVRRWWARRLLPQMPLAQLETFGRNLGLERRIGESRKQYRDRICKWLQTPGHPG